MLFRSAKVKEKAEEIKVKETMLPQLPKKFKLKDEEIIAGKTNEILNQPKQEDEVPSKKDDVLTEPSEKKEKKKNESLKRIALERLLKEKARLEKKFDKKTVSPLDKTLKERKKELDAKIKGADILLAGKNSTNNTYALKLKKWVARHYTLPEIYN